MLCLNVRSSLVVPVVLALACFSGCSSSSNSKTHHGNDASAGGSTGQDAATDASDGGLGTVTAIVAGSAHTCALLSGGSIRCWGDNNSGQVGDGKLTTANRLTPHAVAGVHTATAITAGGENTCALLADGSVDCWGDNQDGELGEGKNVVAEFSPVAVVGLSNAVSVSTNGSHTCAALAGGSVMCWGRNNTGQLGIGSNGGQKNAPVPVPGISKATAVAVGDGFTCALLSDTTVKCWGDNLAGQLGIGNQYPVEQDSPVAVPGLSGVKSLVAGGEHIFALMSDGTAQCWGDDFFGELADSSSNARRYAPEPVPGVSGISATSTTYGHTCLLLAGGKVRCAGSNTTGQLGDGTKTDHTSLSSFVNGVSNAFSIAAGDEGTGYGHTCAAMPNRISCWGVNDRGQLGDGSTIDHTQAKAISWP